MGPMVRSQYKATSAILSTLFVNKTALKTTLHISRGWFIRFAKLRGLSVLVIS
jgi:hypothetical protein